MACKSQSTILVASVLLVWGMHNAGFGVFMGSNVQAAGSAQHSKEDVITFTANDLYETEETVGFSNLVRKNDKIMMQVKTSDLIPGGVYTYVCRWCRGIGIPNALFVSAPALLSRSPQLASCGPHTREKTLGAGRRGVH